MGCLILTGGTVEKDAHSVKGKAMYGAFRASTEDKPAGLIGILPGYSGTGERKIEGPTKVKNAYELNFYTGLESKRNLLTGSIPDIVIALSGGVGTLTEIAYADLLGKQIIFLSSLDNLRKKFQLPELKAKVNNLLKEDQEVEKVVLTLNELFSNNSNTTNYLKDMSTAEEVSTFVLKILKNFTSENRIQAKFPEEIKNFEVEFGDKLKKLMTCVKGNNVSN